MCGLMWEDIDLSLKALTVRLSKNGKAWHVPLNKAALDALRTLHERGKRTDPVFLNSHSKRLARPRHWFEPVIKEAKFHLALP
jgi:integrase